MIQIIVEYSCTCQVTRLDHGGWSHWLRYDNHITRYWILYGLLWFCSRQCLVTKVNITKFSKLFRCRVVLGGGGWMTTPVNMLEIKAYSVIFFSNPFYLIIFVVKNTQRSWCRCPITHICTLKMVVYTW